MQNSIRSTDRIGIQKMARKKRHKFSPYTKPRVCESLATPPILGPRVPYSISGRPQYTSFYNRVSELLDNIEFFGIDISIQDDTFSVNTYPTLFDPPSCKWGELKAIGFPVITPDVLGNMWDMGYPEGFTIDPTMIKDEYQEQFSFMEDMPHTHMKPEDFPRQNFILEPFLLPIWGAEAVEAELFEDNCFEGGEICQFLGRTDSLRDFEHLKLIIDEVKHIDKYYGNIY